MESFVGLPDESLVPSFQISKHCFFNVSIFICQFLLYISLGLIGAYNKILVPYRRRGLVHCHHKNQLPARSSQAIGLKLAFWHK